MVPYEYLNTLPAMIIMFIVFWGTLAVLGYMALKLNDNRGRFSIRTVLVLMVCVAILCVWVKIMMAVK